MVLAVLFVKTEVFVSQAMSNAATFLTEARRHVGSCGYDDARVYFSSALKEMDKCASASACTDLFS